MNVNSLRERYERYPSVGTLNTPDLYRFRRFVPNFPPLPYLTPTPAWNRNVLVKKALKSTNIIHKNWCWYRFCSEQDEHSYLSYENYPVLCRDAAAILLPQGEKNQKKYVCKQVFDCCRKCNWLFYLCLKLKGNTYGFCMRGAYKCICNCIEKKSYNELPYNPVS